MVQTEKVELVGICIYGAFNKPWIRSSNGKLGLFSILSTEGSERPSSHRFLSDRHQAERPKKGVAGIILRGGFMAATHMEVLTVKPPHA